VIERAGLVLLDVPDRAWRLGAMQRETCPSRMAAPSGNLRRTFPNARELN